MKRTPLIRRLLSLFPVLIAVLLLFAGPGCSDEVTVEDTGTDTTSDTEGDTEGDTEADTEPDMVADTGDMVVDDVTPDTPEVVEDMGDDVTDMVGGDAEVGDAADAADPCAACNACETCEVADGGATCVSTCDEGLVCGSTGSCVRAGAHAAFTQLAGPFETGPEVTEACVTCHADEAEAFMATSHWNWLGDTPGLEGHDDEVIGKRNLINNFCVAVPTNEGRCSQCHNGYGWRDDTFDFGDPHLVDCLSCHADPASGYARGTTTAGPADGVDLLLAAQSVGPTSVQNCGSCHFNAGGGDNVKIGDMGSVLARATPADDVHMGNEMTCSSCHAGDDHTMLGSGVHLPVSAGELACADCHTAEPHDSGTLNEHALDIACETCHIPTFSRSQPTKMFWDWSTAGNRTVGENGIRTTTLPGGQTVRDYDYMKGDFVWEVGVTPTYGWHNGSVRRMAIMDAYAEGQGSEENPVVLGEPLATYDDADARIYPFKVMRGVQPALLDARLVLVPRLFGPGGFWASIPPAESYTEAGVRALWTTALREGALGAGQIANAEDLGDEDWGWVHTQMYLGINHEVAPADQALGAAGCSDCHGGSGVFDWEALGYTCDPITDAASCGSRHYDE